MGTEPDHPDHLAAVRAACRALPEVEERLSHGTPAFFVRGQRAFVYAWIDGHHDIDFPHLWCAAAPGVQAAILARESDRYFKPPYVGGRGWIGVRLDHGISADDLTDLCEDAYRAVARSTLVRQLED